MLRSRTHTSSGVATPAPGAISPELRRLALAIMLGAFMVTLDMTMVNVALSTLARTFATSVTTIQWVAIGYLLALAVSIPMTGWAIERFGARTSWVASLLMFIGGSVLCGLAWSSGSLIAFRVLQGFGGGMLIPLAQTILAQAAGPDRLGRVMAAVGIPAMLGPVLGPVLGGVIVTDLSWRVMFYINVPVCLLAVAAAYRVAMPTRAAGAGTPRLDVVGLALLSPGIAAVIYGLAEVGSYGGFTNPHVVVPIATGLALLVGFAVHALRTRDPIIDLRLFRSRGFSAASALVLLFTMAMLGIQLLLPLYYQQVRHQSALDAGLLLAPRGIGMAVALVIAGKLSDRIGPRPIVLVGLLLSAVSTLAYTQIGDHTSVLALSLLLVINGAGLGAALVPSLAAPYRTLRNEQIPRATSAIRILQQLGGSFGVAILAVVLQRELVHHANHAASLAAAYGQTFWWALAFIALAAIPALMLPGSLGRRQLEPAAATA
ncbi:MAG TPA: DHA2 family efflux MFS transporter permease subunit [Solirubrobacteraceae bacterium]|nr:DHA2 family efflux MFS transporter permease subunit [Solirubrobacteraceae bacterium]